MSAGSVPPNYNPNDSMLKGGESVPIVPVQGGGSLTGVPSPSYNPNESLLNGGENVPIVPVRGGAKGNAASTTSTSSSSGSESKEDSESKGDSENENNLNDLDDLNNNNNNAGSNTASAGSGSSGNDLSGNAFSEVENRSNLPETEGDDEEQGEDEKGEEDDKPSVPCEAPVSEEDRSEMEDLSDTFESSEKTAEATKFTDVKTKALEYKLRRPARNADPENYTDPIYNDWMNLEFTEQETEFLNSLNLSPKLLFQTFYCLDRDWKKELAEFLYFMSVESCWPARATLTLDKCRTIREFLSLVCAQMRVQELRKYQSAKEIKPANGKEIEFNETGEGEEKEGEEGEGAEEGKGKGKEGEGGEEGNNDNLDNLDNLNDDENNEKENKPKHNNMFEGNINEVIDKILKQIEQTRKGAEGRQLVLEEVAEGLPPEYQTEEFLDKLTQKAIIDRKDPWYKKLYKKFFKKNPAIE